MVLVRRGRCRTEFPVAHLDPPRADMALHRVSCWPFRQRMAMKLDHIGALASNVRFKNPYRCGPAIGTRGPFPAAPLFDELHAPERARGAVLPCALGWQQFARPTFSWIH